MKISLRAVGYVHGSDRIVSSRFPLLIGRSPEAALMLHDRWVSRLHWQIDEVSGRFVLRDLGSKHGTFVNGQRVTEAPLALGDQIDIGMSRFVVAEEDVACDTASVEIALPLSGW
jgi:pSer/pThr/pTyr-binding forkhead associated (FHA) protein